MAQAFTAARLHAGSMTLRSSATAAEAEEPLQRVVTNPKYRPDIDGLRAIAVLSVIFFHVGYQTFSGGWVGVDVFFVISGFLITRLINDQIAAGTFSFGNFYARRARRLFASLFFTIAASCVAASLIFDRVYLQHFAGEVVYALVAASNFFYWLDGGYFGVAEQYKPLLHTWSLGVEEQFYLIWPLTMVLILRYCRRYVGLLVALAAVASLLLADYYFYLGAEKAVFLLLPGRIFEFAIGAALVLLVQYQRLDQRILEASLLLGLALVFCAVLRFTPSTPFPTLYALIPCVGAALIIFGGTSIRLRWLLANRPMVGIGKISYSLYLIHWPMIVFYSYHRLEPLDQLERALICSGSVVAAALMYVFIEQPFRDPHRTRFSLAALGFSCTAAVLVLLVPASIVWAKGSLIWRGSSVEVTAQQLQQLREQQKQDEVDVLLRGRAFDSDGKRVRLMFVGDSHSGDMAAAMLLNLGAEHYDFARLTFAPACFSSADRRRWILRLMGAKGPCEAQVQTLRNSRSLAEADYLFIVVRWSPESIDNFDEGLALLRGLTKARIIIVGQNAIFPTFDDSLRYLSRLQLQRLNHVMYQQRSSVDLRINERLRNLAATNNVTFIDRQSVVCSAEASICEVVGPDGRFLYSDTNHWSYAGRSVFGKLMVKRLGCLLGSVPATP